MAKERPLTEKQAAMLERLKSYSSMHPFLPIEIGERATCESLDRRGLLNGKLILASFKNGGKMREYKRAVWLKEPKSDG